jgi:hypothetical protein
MMGERAKSIDEFFTICLSLKVLLVFSLKFKLATGISNQTIDYKRNNHSCYTCIEPLVGYSKFLI